MENEYKALKKEKNPFFNTRSKKTDNKINKKHSTPFTKRISKKNRKSLETLNENSGDYLKSIKILNASIIDYNQSVLENKETKRQLKESQEKADYARSLLAKMHDTYPQEIKDRIGTVDYTNSDVVIRVCTMILNDEHLRSLLRENEVTA